jgi:GNAT superfamily N-acetyltransferase
MTYEIREVTVDDVLGNPRSLELFVEHWDEIALNKQVMVLKPDTERYRAMESAGMVLILAAYLGDELVGYSVNFLTHHLHYADLHVASNDLLFVTPEYRASRVGLQLIRATEAAAKERGAKLMLWHAKEHTALATLMPRLGYGVQDIIFSREI